MLEWRIESTLEKDCPVFLLSALCGSEGHAGPDGDHATAVAAGVREKEQAESCSHVDSFHARPAVSGDAWKEAQTTVVLKIIKAQCLL